MKTTYKWTAEYSDTHGDLHEAVQIPWDEVSRILGHDHTGSYADDEVLTGALIDAGYPEWVLYAYGWFDANGWGLIGPERDAK